MTEDRLPLAALLAKAGHGDFLHSVAEAMVRLPMETDVNGLIGAVLPEARDERATQNRYMQAGVMAELTPPPIDAVPPQITTVAA